MHDSEKNIYKPLKVLCMTFCDIYSKSGIRFFTFVSLWTRSVHCSLKFILNLSRTRNCNFHTAERLESKRKWRYHFVRVSVEILRVLERIKIRWSKEKRRRKIILWMKTSKLFQYWEIFMNCSLSFVEFSMEYNIHFNL